MNFVNKLGLVLTVIFVISLVVLSLQILYLLWRKRRFQQAAGPTVSVEFGGGGDHQPPTLSPSKELLYFFCWKNYQASRIEPADASVAVAVVPTSAPTEDEELEEMLKLHELYGASRALFTIKEESEMENESASSLPRNAVVTARAIETKDAGEVLTDIGGPTAAVLTATAREVVVIEMDEEEEDDEATLFRTPCASPPYYTPSPSPPRDQDRQDPEAPSYYRR